MNLNTLWMRNVRRIASSRCYSSTFTRLAVNSQFAQQPSKKDPYFQSNSFRQKLYQEKVAEDLWLRDQWQQDHRGTYPAANFIKISNPVGDVISHPVILPDLRDGDQLNIEGKYVPLPFTTGVRIISRLWLRDNCPCPKCRRQDTFQREVDIFSLDALPEAVPRMRQAGLEVTWAPDHVSLYPWDWLYKHKGGRKADYTPDDPTTMSTPRILWNSSKILESPPSIEYDEIMAGDQGVGKWLTQIRAYGFCFVDGVPVSPEKTQELLERISFIRPTHYGGFYDFTSDLTMKDTAYTSEAIGPHTDTTYFSDPVGLQMFHLLSHEGGTGGESLLVDGYMASKLLGPEDAHVLNKIRVSWHASGNEGINILPYKRFPVLEGYTRDRRCKRIRWNNADRGTIHPDFFEAWYEAAKKFNNILNDNDMQHREQLRPGRALIFDNWRILHGRTAFTGKRRMCGGYINRDDYMSRWMNTNYTREEIMAFML